MDEEFYETEKIVQENIVPVIANQLRNGDICYSLAGLDGDLYHKLVVCRSSHGFGKIFCKYHDFNDKVIEEIEVEFYPFQLAFSN